MALAVIRVFYFKEIYMDFYHCLAEIMMYDAGHRGLKVPQPDLKAVEDALSSAERVLVLTGFPVLDSTGCPHAETDGPIGAAETACMMAALGAKVWLAADETDYAVLCAAAKVYGVDTGIDIFDCSGIPIAENDKAIGRVDMVKIPFKDTDKFAEEFLNENKITHLISIERPGKGCSGHFCSMRGKYLDRYVADTDCFLSKFKGVSIAVGDGGNELGMGKYKSEIIKNVDHGDEIAASLAADHVLTAGVSNWWGAGLSALLEHRTGKHLLVDYNTEKHALSEMLKAGALDGCSAKAEMTVDSLPLELHLERRELVKALLAETE